MKADRNKLIITVTANPSWIYPNTKNHPETAEEIADSIADCCKAGASIAHIHAPGIQKETIRKIRDRCDIIIQVGLSGDALDKRRPVFEAEPDMMSVMLTHHDEQFTKESFNVLHLKSELEDYCRLCLKHDVKPEFEVWHTGAYWNLRYLEKKGLVKKPYFLSLFFGWPGGTWTPPEADEFLHRIRYLPEGSLFTTSVMHEAQMKLLLLTVENGGHVRVGTEDYPYNAKGALARDNAELVAQMSDLSRKLGRSIASVDEARSLIGIEKKS
jgi:3-keto-5-aminohexanoate cleavage enzyme